MQQTDGDMFLLLIFSNVQDQYISPTDESVPNATTTIEFPEENNRVE